MKKLDNIAKVSVSPATKIDAEGDIKILRASDISNGSIDYSSVSRGSFKSNKKNSKSFLKKGDIVFQAKGSKFEAAVVNEDYESLVSSQIYFNIRINEGEFLTPEYLAWFINSRIAADYFDAYSSGATIKAVTKSTLLDLIVHEPNNKLKMDKITDLIKSFASEKSKTVKYLENKELLVNESIIKSIKAGAK